MPVAGDVARFAATPGEREGSHPRSRWRSPLKLPAGRDGHSIAKREKSNLRALVRRMETTKESICMSAIATSDGTQIYYKDWGSGQPVVFSHGWPLDADAWESQMVFLASNGYRCIAHDRRGHGRSSQPWTGNDMDTYADDLSELLERLDLREAAMIGHSMGGGEVARYIGRYGTSRVARVVLVGSVTPLMLKTKANPG